MTISSPRHEFDYVEPRSCLRTQCSCFCGTGSCRFCCRGCPPMKESTLTRMVYIFFLMISVGIMALCLSADVQNGLMRLFPDDFSVCEWLGAGSTCHAGRLMGYLAVYRIGLAISLYHLILMFSTCGTKTSKDCRAGFHNGFWLYKFIMLVILGFVVFLIPDYHDYFITGWMYVAMTGGATFIVIQLLVLVFLVHKWTDKIQARIENDGSPVLWYAFLGPGIVVFQFVLCGAGVCLLYFYFASDEGCHANQWFIFINAGGCFLISVVSGVRKDPKPVVLRLLHASLISLYVIYLTWVGISSAPRRFQRFSRPTYSPQGRSNIRERFTGSFQQEFYCGPNRDEETWSDHVIPYLSFVITLLTVVYGSVGISESENCRDLMLPGCPLPPEEMEELEKHDVEDAGGQMVIRDEKRALHYSYSLFHAMMVLACLLIMMHMTQWHTPTHATLLTFGRSWASVWIKIISSWCCLLLYLVTVLYPSVLPSVMPAVVPMNKATSMPTIEMNGHAIESENDSMISEEAVPLTLSKRPTILTMHQETTV